MRAFDMSHGYPTVVVEDVDGWVCGECVCRGVTGLCFLHGVAGAPQVEDTQSACSGLMARLDRYNEKCGTTWTVVNEYPLELAEALFAL